MILRLLNWQGIAGIGAGLLLAILLLVQKGEAAHWKKQSDSFERLYQQEQAAFATTVVNARAAADQARAADRANAERVAAEQQTITERTMNDFEARLAAARSSAQRLRAHPETPADPGARANTSVPGIPDAARGAAQNPVEDRLSESDALTATEQAIQLDELIAWIRRQAVVDNNPKAVASPPGD